MLQMLRQRVEDFQPCPRGRGSSMQHGRNLTSASDRAPGPAKIAPTTTNEPRALAIAVPGLCHSGWKLPGHRLEPKPAARRRPAHQHQTQRRLVRHLERYGVQGVVRPDFYVGCLDIGDGVGIAGRIPPVRFVGSHWLKHPFSCGQGGGRAQIMDILGFLVILLFGAYLVGGWPYVAVAFALALIAAVVFGVLFRSGRP
jgi:hypothetical protein